MLENQSHEQGKGMRAQATLCFLITNSSMLLAQKQSSGVGPAKTSGDAPKRLGRSRLVISRDFAARLCSSAARTLPSRKKYCQLYRLCLLQSIFEEKH